MEVGIKNSVVVVGDEGDAEEVDADVGPGAGETFDDDVAVADVVDAVVVVVVVVVVSGQLSVY